MTTIWIILVWILGTLAVSSIGAIVAKRYGVEYLIATMTALAVISNVLAAKIVSFGPFTVAGGIITFSITFLITDIISEKFSKKEAQKAVICGAFANVLFVLSVFIAVSWDAAPFALELGEMFNTVLGLTPRIAIASIVTYFVSQFADIGLFHFWKNLTKGKHMWLRNNGSTIISQLIDTTIFTMLAFYGVFATADLPMIIIGGWLAKVVIAILDTPFMYLIVWLMDKFPQKKKLVLAD